MHFQRHPWYARRGYKEEVQPQGNPKKVVVDRKADAIEKRVKAAHKMLAVAINTYITAVADGMGHHAEKRAKANGWTPPTDPDLQGYIPMSGEFLVNLEVLIEHHVAKSLEGVLLPDVDWEVEDD